MKLVSILAVLLSTSAFAAGGSSSTGVPHPASFICDQLHGKTIRYSTSRGEDELCQLDQAMVSSMTLWISLELSQKNPPVFSPKPSFEKALRVFLEHPPVQKWHGGNPASEYCARVGGTPTLAHESSGSEFGVCVFKEQGHLSTIEEWTLMRGPSSPGNASLANLLKGSGHKRRK